MGISLTGFAHW